MRILSNSKFEKKKIAEKKRISGKHGDFPQKNAEKKTSRNTQKDGGKGWKFNCQIQPFSSHMATGEQKFTLILFINH